jgi:hypothetical protein
LISLSTIALAVNGRVRGNKVTAPGPEAATHKVRWKRKRHTLTIYPHGENDIRVNCHAGQDPIAMKDWVRQRANMPAWQPRKRTPKLPPLATRQHYLRESLRIAQDRKHLTFEQFALVINDLKNVDCEAILKTRAAAIARAFGFHP